jgi:myosin heavy subunit
VSFSNLSVLKIFMRESLENHLEKERSQMLNKAAATIQRTLKGYIQRKNFERQRQATIVLQRQYRRWIDQKK